MEKFFLWMTTKTQEIWQRQLWKNLVIHGPTYTSATNGYKVPGMDWDWNALGVDVIFNGDKHWYERLNVSYPGGDVPHITEGASGCGNISPKPPIAESVVIKAAGNDVRCIRGGFIMMTIKYNSLSLNFHGVGLTGQDNAGLDTLVIE